MRARAELLREGLQRSPITKRSIMIGGHRTSVSLEDEYWQALHEIAKPDRVCKLVRRIDLERGHNNLSAALRLHVLRYYQNKVGKMSFDGIYAAG
jgi:predicted DNA-binding ribbon-helix-helix protein